MPIVKFPDEISLGELYLAKRDNEKTWLHFAKAKGEVLVPDDSLVYLRMMNPDPELVILETPLWHLANLEPDDLFGLFCRGNIEENFRYISRLNLKTLYMMFVRNPGKVLQHLQNMQTLKYLGLTESRIAKGDIAKLENLPALEDLNLAETSIGDEDVARISQLDSLKNLIISSTPITDLALDYLKDHQTLQTLILDSNNITDESLKYLTELPALNKLSIKYTKITLAGLKALKERLPHVDILSELQD